MLVDFCKGTTLNILSDGWASTHSLSSGCAFDTMVPLTAGTSNNSISFPESPLTRTPASGAPNCSSICRKCTWSLKLCALQSCLRQQWNVEHCVERCLPACHHGKLCKSSVCGELDMERIRKGITSPSRNSNPLPLLACAGRMSRSSPPLYMTLAAKPFAFKASLRSCMLLFASSPCKLTL